MADIDCSASERGRRALLPVSLLLLGWFLSFPNIVYGQGQLLGALHGTAKDQHGGVLPGVRVTATPVEPRPALTAVTDAFGYYTIKDIPPGEYEIKAELAGFATLVQPGILARAGLTLSLELVMIVGGVDEIVTVRRDSPLLESSAATTAVNISGDLQRSLPTSQRRNWSDALLLTPGVISADSTFGGLTQFYMVHGSDVASHVFQVDGADLASASSSQAFYLAFNTDLIADVHISTAGTDASAPLGTGAVMNVTTKSGTNSLSGAATLVYQSTRWNGSNVPGGTSSQVGLVQPDLSLGGPILKDRLWYFGAYRRINASTGVARTQAQQATMSALDPSFHSFDLTNTANLYFVKVTALPFAAHRLSTFYQSDSNRSEIGGAQDNLPVPREIGGHAVAARLSSTWGSSIITELGTSYNDKNNENPPLDVSVPFQSVYRSVVLSGGRWLGRDYVGHIGAPGSAWTSQPSQKPSLSFDLSYSIPRLGPGTHELKSGVFLQPRLFNEATLHYVNGGIASEQLVLRDSQDPSAGVTTFLRSVFPESTVLYRSVGSDAGFYLQDTWRHKRLTATVGIRLDRVRYEDKLFRLTTQHSQEIGPRLGVNYALDAESRSVARFTWSRVPDRVPGAAYAGTISPTVVRHYDLNLDGLFETVDTLPGSSSLSPNRLFNPDLHQPYVHEITAGYRRQFKGQVSIDIGIVRRLMKDRFAMVETNGLYDGHVFVGYRDQSQNEIYDLTNNVWNWPVYTALELIAAKRTAHIEVIGSYVRQWQRLAGTWQPNDPAFFVQPNAFDVTGGIGSSSGSLSNPAVSNSLAGSSLSIAGVAASPWQDHIVRAGVNVSLPWGLAAAANYTYQSGPWSGPVVRLLSQPDATFGPATITLANGRVVQNPLATVVRFAYPTRGEGQFHLDGLHVLNTRITKRITVRQKVLSLMLDLFNITNNGAEQGLVSGGNVVDSANFRVGQNRQTPRGAQVGARFTF